MVSEQVVLDPFDSSCGHFQIKNASLTILLHHHHASLLMMILCDVESRFLGDFTMHFYCLKYLA